MSYRFPYMIAQMFLLYAQYNAYIWASRNINYIRCMSVAISCHCILFIDMIGG